MTQTPASRFIGAAVITGGSSGIGASTTRRLLDEGVRVGVVDLQPPADAQVPYVCCDVCDPADVERAFATLLDELGPIAHLACVAGIGPQRVATTDLPVSDWRRMLAVHVDGTLFSCQSFMRQSPPVGSSIVTIGSIASKVGLPGRAHYVTAKGAIDALTRSLAVEWAASGVRVNCVHPGYVRTPMIEAALKNRLIVDDPSEHAALRRFAEPQEIASMITYLLSTDASFVTGEGVVVDGGFLVKKLN